MLKGLDDVLQVEERTFILPLHFWQLGCQFVNISNQNLMLLIFEFEFLVHHSYLLLDLLVFSYCTFWHFFFLSNVMFQFSIVHHQIVILGSFVIEELLQLINLWWWFYLTDVTDLVHLLHLVDPLLADNLVLVFVV